ncbi:Calx-beta domain-containing protein [Reyranella sp.]|uniref:Calx-beta domain-containing protein n=1 Tax=Reyranella sp. TaxID=1929291 RepID=UPI003D0BCAD1
MATFLVNGLGGASGFGENAMPRLDDTPSLFIDLTAVMPGGLNFFGTIYTGLFLNYNGSVTFGSALEEYTPTAITASSNIPIIAPFWADTDTRSGTTAASPGGTSTGSNLVWYDLDATGHTFTATWDDVGYYDEHLDKLNAFQLQLIAVGTSGDFDITFRYETINWTTGDASGGDGGLFGQVAVAGYSSGDGESYFQLSQSGNQAAMLALPTASNASTPGLFSFSVRQGVPVVAQISIAASSADQPEGNNGFTLFTFTVSLTGDTSVERTVSYAVTGTEGADAATDSDFDQGMLPAGTVSFGVGDTVQTITVKVQGDTAVEADETFLVTLSNATGGATFDADKATGTIRNDDRSIVSIAALSANASEGNSGTTAFTFTVSLDRVGVMDQAVDWSVAGTGTHAADAADFGGALPSGTAIIAAGETSSTVTVLVSGDSTVEHDEGFTITLSNESPGLSLGTSVAAGTIANDDKSIVSIAEAIASRPEGDSGAISYEIPIVLDQAAVTPQTVAWAVTGFGDHPADAADFDGALPSGIVTFAAGETMQTVTVTVSGDTTVEFDEGAVLTLSDQSAGLALGTASALGIILNDDMSIVSIAALSASKPEGDDASTLYAFTITLDQPGVSPQTVDWTVTGSGTHAADGADFGGLLPFGSASFGAGETTRTITVAVAGDGVAEPDEGFKVTLSNHSSGLALGIASATGIIQNDDSATVSIAAVTAALAEGDSGTTLFDFEISLSQPAVGGETIGWSLSGAGAHPADAADFGGALPGGTVTFAEGSTSAIVSVAVSGDTKAEFDEGFAVELSGPSPGLTLDTSTADATILNDDTPVVSIAAAVAIKAEGNAGTTAFTFTVSLDQAATTDQPVDWTVAGSGDQAADGADFGGSLPTGSVTFIAGEVSKTVTVLVAGDTVVEPDEGFKVVLSNVPSTLVPGVTTANGTIVNDDATVSIAAVAAGMAEGDSGVTEFAFEVTLTGDSTVSHSILYAVSGSGENPADAADFSGGALPTGTLTFGIGETSRTILVKVAGDTSFESDETFAVDLSSPSSGLTIATGLAGGSILNDDTAGPPQPTVVHDDAYVGLAGQALSMSAANGVLFNDSGSNLAASEVNGPAHGTLMVDADGGFTYTPGEGFAGTDSFRYLAFGELGGEYRTVDVHIARLTPDATLDLLSLTAEQQVALAYTTFFSRGADAAGFRFWVGEFEAGLPRLGPAALFSAIADAFAASTEARTLYPFLDHARGASDAEIGDFLDGIYNNLFNRSADAGGLAYWTGQIREAIASGQFVGSILDDILGGARNSEAGQDVMTVLGKIAVSLSYVHDQQRFHAPWTAVDDGAAAIDLLRAVTADPQTVLVGVVQAYDLTIASLARADGFGEVPISAF